MDLFSCPVVLRVQRLRQPRPLSSYVRAVRCPIGKAKAFGAVGKANFI